MKTLTLLIAIALCATFRPALAQQKPEPEKSVGQVAALQPHGPGHQFVFYGDCCSGIPGIPHEANFAGVNAVLAQLVPKPEFICFIGDHVFGQTQDYDKLRSQWRYWLDHEMAWMDKSIPLYHSTSNHNTYDAGSEAVWREIFPDIPKNGPPGQEGLSYLVRRGDLLLVFVNTNSSVLGGGRVEHEWLNKVLESNSGAKHKFVLGHYPIFPVNGYDLYGAWRVIPSDGEAFWSVLVRHHVDAYLCSHILAFDCQVHDGIPQITTGGAGTFGGPGGLMPGQTEYFHAVQMAVDRAGLRCQVLDTHGQAREWLDWPLNMPPPATWSAVDADAPKLSTPSDWKATGPKAAHILLWRFSGVSAASGSDDGQTMLCGWDTTPMEAPAILWIGLAGVSQRLTVRLVPEAGGGVQEWQGTALAAGEQFDVQVAIHTGMGPGGVIWRKNDSSPWTSMYSTSARGGEKMAWPPTWSFGHAQNGPKDEPFLGKDLRISWKEVEIRLRSQ